LKVDAYKTEEEQVQAIKQWWKENSLSIIAGIVIGGAILGGYSYFGEYKQSQAQQASVIYSSILATKEDKTKDVETLKNDYSSTPYAALASLILAKDAVDKNEIEKAVSELKWVVDNATDDGVQHIATQRLARLYLNQNDIDAAESLIQSIKSQEFSAIYSEIRGDINLAKNLPVQAKENYRLALSAMTSADQRYRIIKMKLDDLTQAKVTK